MSLERAYIKVIFPGQIREGILLIKTNTLGFEPGNRCQEPRMGWGEKATDSGFFLTSFEISGMTVLGKPGNRWQEPRMGLGEEGNGFRTHGEQNKTA